MDVLVRNDEPVVAIIYWLVVLSDGFTIRRAATSQSSEKNRRHEALAFHIPHSPCLSA